ncbi:hypothetical protein ABRQ01_10800 [Pectobacterium aroidearum]|uniref:hypothetical protein n=1 Tax=Pectobacterium aroidearum TaxID=1201031 RepID=UPI0032EDC1B8
MPVKSRLEHYRIRQTERVEMMCRAIDEGRTTVVPSGAPVEEKPRRIRFLTLTPDGSKTRFWAVRGWP